VFRSNKICPKCGLADIRPASYRHFWDYLLRVFLLEPYRCRICLYRFFRTPF
jgi:hypothetical protein